MKRLGVGLSVLLAACGPDVALEDTTAHSEQALGQVLKVEAEDLMGVGAQIISEFGSSNNRALRLYAVGSAEKSVNLPQVATGIIVRAKAVVCGANPTLRLDVDNVQRLSVPVSAAGYVDFTAPVMLPVGSHTLKLVYASDSNVGCDGALIVDTLTAWDDGSYVPPPPPPPYVGDVVSYEGESQNRYANLLVINEPTGSNGRSLRYGINGLADKAVFFPWNATHLNVRARGESCGANRQMRVLVDGIPTATVTVSSTTLVEHTIAVPMAAGNHTIGLEHLNDTNVGCDGALVVDKVRVSSDGTYTPPPPPPPVTSFITVEAERMSGTGFTVSDPPASAGRSRLVDVAGTVTGGATTTGPLTSVTITARADVCGTAPTMTVSVDGVQHLSTVVSQSGWTDLVVTLPTALPAGVHQIAIGNPNDFNVGCNGALRLDKVVFRIN